MPYLIIFIHVKKQSRISASHLYLKWKDKFFIDTFVEANQTVRKRPTLRYIVFLRRSYNSVANRLLQKTTSISSIGLVCIHILRRHVEPSIVRKIIIHVNWTKRVKRKKKTKRRRRTGKENKNGKRKYSEFKKWENIYYN